MRRPSAVLLVLLAIPGVLGIAPPAHAQEDPPAGSVRLLAQTPWTSPKDPELRIVLRVRNDADLPIEAPEVGWTLGPVIGARGDYEAALRDGPTTAWAADTVFLDPPLDPGETVDVVLELPTDAISAISSEDSGVYPLELELRSAGAPIAALTTAAIHVVREPLARVSLSWWTEIDVPIAFRPDGALVDPAFEQVLAESRGVVAQVGALAGLVDNDRPDDRVRLDVVVSPVALEQLELAADGYLRLSDGTRATDQDPAPQAAANTLRLLRDLAASPAVRLHATPFASPHLPALLSSPLLAPHLEEHWRLGDATFERVLGESPDPTVARPPGLAFDAMTLDALRDRGMTTLLGAPDSVERPLDPLDLAPPPAAVVETATGAPVRIVLPDPSTQGLLADADLRRDPVLTAQAVLGELATIWRELPVPEPPTRRGLALELPADLPGATWAPLVGRLVGAPFLEAVHAEDLPDRIEPPPVQTTLEPEPRGSYSQGYVQDVYTTARDITAFEAMVREPAEESERLWRAILYAESSQYVGDELEGHRWIDAVNRITDTAFGDLAPDTTRVLTFTSRTGTIPLRMGDPGDRVVEVRVEMRSQRVDFLDSGVRTIRLDRPDQLVTFEAEVKASGRSTIDVYVYSPSNLLLTRSVLVVSSTAVNPIALIITVVAGLVLVGLWSRRLFRRRNP
ncbi:MAG TPA: DUF6049 family protein [Actinomycetota bacterium]